MIAFNCQAEMVGFLKDQPDLPIIAILHDDEQDYFKPFEGLNVWAWRAMSPYSVSYHALPVGARFIFDNEADNDPDVNGWAQYLAQLRHDRPDLTLIAPASNCANWPDDGDWPEDPTIQSLCDLYSLHVPTFGTQPEMLARAQVWNKRWCVTEVEADPTDPDNNDATTLAQRLYAAAGRALLAGAECAAIWGKDPQFSDGVRMAPLRAAVATFNATVSLPVPPYLLIGGRRH